MVLFGEAAPTIEVFEFVVFKIIAKVFVESSGEEWIGLPASPATSESTEIQYQSSIIPQLAEVLPTSGH